MMINNMDLNGAKNKVYTQTQKIMTTTISGGTTRIPHFHIPGY